MNKALARVLFPFLIIATVLAFMLALAPSRTGHAIPSSNADAHLAGKRLPNQPATPTPTPSPESHPGSTGGIMVMGFAIVFIIVVPILLQRSLWAK